MTHNEYIEKRNSILATLTEAHKTGDHETFTAKDAEINDLDIQWDKANKVEERNARLEALQKSGRAPARKPVDPEGSRQRTSDVDEDPRSTKEYRNLFLDYLQGRADIRSLSILSGPEGAYAMAPAQFDPIIVTPQEKSGGMRAKINLTLLDGLLGTTGLSITARSATFIKGEEIDLDNDTEMTLTFAERKLHSWPFTTFKPVQNTFLAGSVIKDPLSWLAEQLRIVKEEKEEALYLYGTGDNEPLGILVADDMGVPSSRHIETGSASGALTYAQMVELVYTVRPAWRKGAELNFCTDAMKQLDKLTDSSGGPLLRDVYTGSGFQRLFMGLPVIENEHITTTATAGAFADNALVGFCWNPKCYHAIQPKIVGVQKSEHRLFEKNKTLVKMMTYLDGGCADSTGVAIAKIIA